ncbi:MAG: amino acid ABC transporter permease, partial [Acholeplasmataceae bacterium]|nr:amino acid ABC transporter permease [Acholeplasmataceae bacterium]
AYISEILRGGVESINVGQMEAGRTLGLTKRQTMRKIIWPQAIKNSLPAIGNEFVVNLKDTSVLSVISVVDLFFAVKQAAGKTYAYVEAFTIAAVIYLILTVSANFFIKHLERKVGQVQV